MGDLRVAWDKYVQVVFIILISVCIVLPILEAPFFDRLPHLEVMVFLERIFWSFFITIIAITLYFILSAPKNLKYCLNYVKHAKCKSRLQSLLGFVMFIYAAADLSCNSLGTLVKILPNQPYAEQMEVISAKARGSKMKSVDLDLKSNADGQIYYLTLSKRLFNYPKFNVGDKLILKGKQNWFGVYIEEFQPARINEQINGVRLR